MWSCNIWIWTKQCWLYNFFIKFNHPILVLYRNIDESLEWSVEILDIQLYAFLKNLCISFSTSLEISINRLSRVLKFFALQLYTPFFMTYSGKKILLYFPPWLYLFYFVPISWNDYIKEHRPLEKNASLVLVVSLLGSHNHLP